MNCLGGYFRDRAKKVLGEHVKPWAMHQILWEE